MKNIYISYQLLFKASDEDLEIKTKPQANMVLVLVLPPEPLVNAEQLTSEPFVELV